MQGAFPAPLITILLAAHMLLCTGAPVFTQRRFPVRFLDDPVLACVIFSLFTAAPPVVDADAAAVTQVWSYIGELIFNMLVLVGSVKMADRIVREMMGL